MVSGTFGGPMHLDPDHARFWLAAIANSSEDAILASDLDGVVTSWSKGAERMFGYATQEMMGRSIDQIIPAERNCEKAGLMETVRRGEVVTGFGAEGRRKDGSIIPVSLSVSPIRDDNDRVIGVSKIARDLTELHQRDALLHAAFDTAPDGIIVVDDDGIVQSFNPAAQGMFGYDAEEVIGQHIRLLMPPELVHQDDLVHMFRCSNGHCARTFCNVEGRRKDGSSIPVRLCVGSVGFPGRPRIVVFLRDRTGDQDQERRLSRLQAELAHASRVTELGQMVSALAHEVAQPLTTIVSSLSMAEQHLAAGDQERVFQSLERIEDEADRARQIIGRLRDFMKKGATERRLVPLRDVIAKASALAFVGLGKGPSLSVHVDPAAAEAVIDRVQIQQVLINLMRNAAEAMAGSMRRELSVTTACRGEMVEISVADSGPGLPDVVRARLFQPFVTTKPNGMGVGLSVCQAIVQAHGGELRAEDGAGGGTVFRLMLPRPRASART